ncbi:MAG: hypothetical protein RLZZ142_1823 [Verrucomicrobiota bacterium]
MLRSGEGLAWGRAAEVAALVFAGRDAHALAKGPREGALVAESDAERDVGDGSVRMEEFAGGGVDAGFQNELRDADTEFLREASAQVPFGESRDAGEFGDGDGASEVVADMLDDLGEWGSAVGGTACLGSLTQGPDDADEGAIPAPDGVLGDDKPVGQSLFVDPDFELASDGLAAREELSVAADVLVGEVGGEKVAVVFAEHGLGGGEAEASPDSRADIKAPAGGVFGKELDSREVVEHLGKGEGIGACGQEGGQEGRVVWGGAVSWGRAARHGRISPEEGRASQASWGSMN